MDPLDDPTFIVTLERLTCPSKRLGDGFAFVFDVFESIVAVRLGFTGTEEVEVGTVDDEDVDRGRHGGGDEDLG